MIAVRYRSRYGHITVWSSVRPVVWPVPGPLHFQLIHWACITFDQNTQSLWYIYVLKSCSCCVSNLSVFKLLNLCCNFTYIKNHYRWVWFSSYAYPEYHQWQNSLTSLNQWILFPTTLLIEAFWWPRCLRHDWTSWFAGSLLPCPFYSLKSGILRP